MSEISKDRAVLNSNEDNLFKLNGTLFVWNI